MSTDLPTIQNEELLSTLGLWGWNKEFGFPIYPNPITLHAGLSWLIPVGPIAKEAVNLCLEYLCDPDAFRETDDKHRRVRELNLALYREMPDLFPDKDLKPYFPELFPSE